MKTSGDPLLRAKFDGDFDNTPATYIWSRLVRMKSTRSGASQKEEAGYLAGGYPGADRGHGRANRERLAVSLIWVACGGDLDRREPGKGFAR